MSTKLGLKYLKATIEKDIADYKHTISSCEKEIQKEQGNERTPNIYFVNELHDARTLLQYATDVWNKIVEIETDLKE